MKTITNIFVRVSEAENLSGFKVADYEKVLTDIITNLGHSIVEKSFYDFKNGAVTGVLLLRESHISIHTWPEDDFLTVEMLTCKNFSAEEEKILLEKIKSVFKTDKLEVIINK